MTQAGDSELRKPGQAGRAAGPFLRRIFRSLAGPAAFSLPAESRRAHDLIAMCHVLLSDNGEGSGLRLPTEILAAYQALDAAGRDVFFDLLSDQLLPDPDQVAQATDAYRRQPSPATLSALQSAVESPRQELFRRLNLARGGIAALIEMRRQLMGTLDRHPERSGIDHDLAHLFKSWFNGGFLVLKRIDWKTSALVLERLIQFEAVHQIQGWGDLRRRLEADRRCYAFFHPALPDEPLIFIEVALTRGMSATVQPLLKPDSPVTDPGLANCAIFYSITNCVPSLRGVSFGNLLIKQVVEDLKQTFPKLTTFATLSPIPDFRKWLMAALASSTEPRLAALADVVSRLSAGNASADVAITPALRHELLRVCAYYLLKAGRGKAPLDSVARFHLANGARLDRLNWMGDTSEIGMRRSFGLMANYVYRLPDLERNHEAYAASYKLAASRDMERLALDSLVTSPPVTDLPASA